jgi:hypothetical protein
VTRLCQKLIIHKKKSLALRFHLNLMRHLRNGNFFFRKVMKRKILQDSTSEWKKRERERVSVILFPFLSQADDNHIKIQNTRAASISEQI